MTIASRVLTAISWKYAAGEIALIVIGVSIALAATSWYEDRKQRLGERIMLAELNVALNADLQNLTKWREEISGIANGLRRLDAELISDESCSAKVLQNVGAVASFRYVHLNLGPYEALKSQGMGLISDEELRLRIVSFYDNVWPDLLTTTQIDYDFISRQVLPYMLTKFSRPEPKLWIPIDESNCGADPVLRNLAVWRLNSLDGFQIADYDIAIREGQKLLQTIDSFLN